MLFYFDKEEIKMVDEVIIRLHDGSKRTEVAGTTYAQLALQISQRVGHEAVAVKLLEVPAADRPWPSTPIANSATSATSDRTLLDLSREVIPGAQVQFVTLSDSEGADVMRHTCAHVMAQAVSRLFPHAKFAIGPVIESGFYYDFADHDFSESDLPAIEAEMRKIIQEDFPVIREEISRADAINLFAARNDRFKVEIIEDLPSDAILSIYRQGEFVDLGRGPHLPSTGKIKAFKLKSIAGAYWRGDSAREQLTRIYAVAFAKKSELEEHLHLLEEAKQRDHRRIGRELELFIFTDDAPGMPIFLQNGMHIRNELEHFERSLQMARGYEEVKTPVILNKRLWEQSGHWSHYKDNMYTTKVDGEEFALKPMNCPGHMLIYKNKPHSYRELPIRIAEYGHVHRHELSGALGGMMRVRSFTQDDAHIFCRPDQIGSEVTAVLDLIKEIYSVFGFSYRIELSTRPDDSMGSDALWQQAETALQNVLDHSGIEYQINPGDGAFYGPKIDFHIRDAIGRMWQCATVQLDFQHPERFNLEYIDQQNRRQRPVVIHRAIFGSIDRFIGILTEHFAGSFPTWLAPIQARVITVAEHVAPYASEVLEALREAGLRAELDGRSEKIGYKIRESQVNKIPFTIIIGEREAAQQAVSVRRYRHGDIGVMPVQELIARLHTEVSSRLL